MKTYPIISKEINSNIDIYAFDKIDGSNIRSEWTKKNGFWKFGSRKRLLGSDQSIICEADQLIIDKYADDLSKIFLKQRYQKVIMFFEFSGEHSFAGKHDENDEHDVVLIDVSPHKKGILPPREFLKIFGGLDIPKILYRGKANNIFVQLVKDRKIEGLTFEGVVCKGQLNRKTGLPYMFKIKTNDWLNKLKGYCKGDEKLFNSLR